MSVICDFGQSFQIANIFWSEMADQNYEMIDIFVSHFLIGDHHLGDKERYPIYILYIYIAPGCSLVHHYSQPVLCVVQSNHVHLTQTKSSCPRSMCHGTRRRPPRSTPMALFIGC
jgi:hypothetical protein